MAIQKKTLYWLCQIGGWSVYGLYMILLMHSDGRLSVYSALDLSFTVLCLLLLSHVYRFYIIRQGWLKLLFGKLLLRTLLSSLILSIAFIPFALLSSWMFSPDDFLSVLDFNALLSSALAGTFLFFCWSVCYFLYHYVSNYNRNLKWEAMINEFELNKLRSQLNPHFIFNALNSVKVLVDEDPRKAQASIDQLSNLLRNSLVMDRKKVITFREEFELVKDYLSLEMTRFEERLRFEHDIDPNSWQHKVPPLMLQTIVENGIKHGISKLKNGGVIKITTQMNGTELCCQVRNSGQYRTSDKLRRNSGYGLKSTIQRLEILYHGGASFRIVNEDSNTVLTHLCIPAWDESEPMVSLGSPSSVASR